MQDILKHYDEPWRFWHTRKHVENILGQIDGLSGISPSERGVLVLAAYFHDVVYEPWRIDNEEKSVGLWKSWCTNHGFQFQEEIADIILDTKTGVGRTPLSKLFQSMDRSILRAPLSKQLDWEDGIFKEYQFSSWPEYRIKRSAWLLENGCEALAGIVANRTPRIAVFPGSFDPFHVGHMDILKKAEKMFDKVIIAIGFNDSKERRGWTNSEHPQGRETTHYKTLLSEFINDLGYPVTVVRGLRGAEDLGYEMRQLRFLEDLKMKAEVIYVPCGREFEHVSSSGIRAVARCDAEAAKRWLNING